MNRMEEYRALLQELEETPARLNFTVARAKAKAKRQKLRRALGVPVTAVAAVCVCFVLLVNVSAPFAAACSAIPFIKDLAEAVSFSPSLSAAVENDWVQPIGLTRSANGAEMTIEYLIVDQKQLNIFYTTGGDAAPLYNVYMGIQGAGGGELSGYGLISGIAKPNGELQHATVDFEDSSMPGELRLECRLFPLEGAVGESAAPSHALDTPEETVQPEPVATLTFDLTFDPKFTTQATVVELNRWVELDGQRILFKNVEIYPTHIRINVEDDPDNTAWLRSLELYAEDESGARYDRPGGIIASGSADSPFFRSFRLDSSYFSESEHLTVCITGAKWLDKATEWTWVDLTTGETGFLPDGVSLLRFSRDGDGASLTFRVHGRVPGNLFMTWRVPGGEADYFPSMAFTTSYDPGEEGEPRQYLEDYTDITFPLENCAGSRVELELDYTRETVFAYPVEIDLS